jgi:hypothetical protein
VRAPITLDPAPTIESPPNPEEIFKINFNHKIPQCLQWVIERAQENLPNIVRRGDRRVRLLTVRRNRLAWSEGNRSGACQSDDPHPTPPTPHHSTTTTVKFWERLAKAGGAQLGPLFGGPGRELGGHGPCASSISLVENGTLLRRKRRPRDGSEPLKP